MGLRTRGLSSPKLANAIEAPSTPPPPIELFLFKEKSVINKGEDDDGSKRMTVSIDEGVSSESDSDNDSPFLIGSASTRKCNVPFLFY